MTAVRITRGLALPTALRNPYAPRISYASRAALRRTSRAACPTRLALSRRKPPFGRQPRRGLLRKLAPHRVDLRCILRHKPPAGALGYQESLAFQLVQCPLHGIRIYGKYAGTEINIDGKDYLIMKQGDILAII